MKSKLLYLACLFLCACQSTHHGDVLITDGQKSVIRNIDGNYGHGTGWPMYARLRLRNGQFRYEFYSDVKIVGRPEVPVTGTYSIENYRLTLNLDPKWQEPEEKYRAVQLEYEPDGDYLKVIEDHNKWSRYRRMTPHAMGRVK